MQASTFAALFVVSLFGVTPAAAQSERTVVVDDPRPMSEALLELAMRHARLITYEDPRWIYAGDIKDVTREVRRDRDRLPRGQAPKVLIPRGGKIDFHYTVATDTREPEDWDALLQNLLADYAAAGRGARFRVERQGDAFHVFPAQLRNAAGAWVTTASILDAYITIPEQALTKDEIIDAICAAVGEAMDVRLGVGVGITGGIGPLGGPPRERFAVNNERARDVLWRELQRRSPGLTWRIFQQPGTNEYFLNGAYVAPPAASSAAPPASSFVPRPTGPFPAGGGPAVIREHPPVSPSR